MEAITECNPLTRSKRKRKIQVNSRKEVRWSVVVTGFWRDKPEMKDHTQRTPVIRACLIVGLRGWHDRVTRGANTPEIHWRMTTLTIQQLYDRVRSTKIVFCIDTIMSSPCLPWRITKMPGKRKSRPNTWECPARGLLMSILEFFQVKNLPPKIHNKEHEKHETQNDTRIKSTKSRKPKDRERTNDMRSGNSENKMRTEKQR